MEKSGSVQGLLTPELAQRNNGVSGSAAPTKNVTSNAAQCCTATQSEVRGLLRSSGADQ